MLRGIPRFSAIALVPFLVFPAACGGREHIDGQSDGTDEHDSVEPDSLQDLPVDEGPPPCESDESCYDSDPCTHDRCDTTSGTCMSTPVDEDGDGHSAAVTVAGIGCPGDDCDDGDPEVFPGAAPDCTGMRDMDCDGLLDGDEDGDGFWTVECPEGADCDDGAPGVHPGAYETCGDGIDQDCDGLVDERLNPLGEIRITEAEGDSTLPSMVWTGSQYMLVWRDAVMNDCDIMFTILSPAGIAVIDNQLLSSRTCRDPWAPSSISWTGSELGIAWFNLGSFSPNEVYFSLVDSSGIVVTGESELFFDGVPLISEPSIAWNGSEFGFVCGNGDVHFYHLSRDANIADGGILDDTDGDPAQPAIVWTGSSYYYSFYKNPWYIDIAIVDSSGHRLPDEWYDLWDMEKEYPDLAWMGDGLGFALERSGSTRVARLDERGALLSYLDVPFGMPDHHGSLVPSITWTGSELGIAYTDVRGPDYFHLEGEIYMLLVNSDCDSMSEQYRITNQEGQSSFPDVVWTGSEFGVAWQNDRDGNLEIYFTRVAICG